MLARFGGKPYREVSTGSLYGGCKTLAGEPNGSDNAQPFANLTIIVQDR